MIKIITRKQARLNKLTTYYTGKPCRKGHYDERDTLTSKCVECVKRHKAYKDKKRKNITPNNYLDIRIIPNLMLRDKGYPLEILYTKNDLLNHLEKHFLDDMTFENYGKLWSIDHFIPIDYFYENEIDDINIINSLGNLFPLYCNDNTVKRNNDWDTFKEQYPERAAKYWWADDISAIHKNELF